MDGSTLVLIELSLTFLLCVGFGAQQLWSLRRDKQQRERERRAREAAGTPPV